MLGKGWGKVKGYVSSHNMQSPCDFLRTYAYAETLLSTLIGVHICY